MKHLINIFIWLSCGVNVFLGGSPYETFSARNYRYKLHGRRNLVKTIDFFIGEGHCERCYKAAALRRIYPVK